MQPEAHWERVYTSKSPDEVSWYQAQADRSLRLIRGTGIPHSGAMIDVGGGASTLVDGLLDGGYNNLTVLDLSSAALDRAKARLGGRANAVEWLQADITRTTLPRAAYELWHDRAVFHFLTEPEDRHAYVQTLLHSVKSGGHVIVATFADDGPLQCSGLTVVRYDPARLHAQFGDGFMLVTHEREAHRTPSGTIQPFTYCQFRKLGS